MDALVSGRETELHRRIRSLPAVPPEDARSAVERDGVEDDAERRGDGDPAGGGESGGDGDRSGDYPGRSSEGSSARRERWAGAGRPDAGSTSESAREANVSGVVKSTH